MLLILDNYDSFTYNLVHYLEELGAATKVLRNDELTVAEAVALAPERVVISPGPGGPDQAGISCALVERLAGVIPILGVCLGPPSHRPSLRRARRSWPTRSSTAAPRQCNTMARTLFVGLQNPFVATRYHSLTVERASLPECLQVSATSEDGMIMGIRHRRWPLEGVQFHP